MTRHKWCTADLEACNGFRGWLPGVIAGDDLTIGIVRDSREDSYLMPGFGKGSRDR